MPLSNDDFNRLALSAADALASKGTPLVESVDQLARDNDMNLEQLKRLCEATNNAAFKALFDKTNASDREVTFDVAKAEDVIARRRGSGSGSAETVKTASAPFDVMAELWPLGSSREVEKIAHEFYVDPLEERARQKTAAHESHLAAATAERVREHLEEVESVQRYKFAKDIDAAVRHFHGMHVADAHSEFYELEKVATALRGAEASPVFAELRKRLDLPALPSDHVEKCAFHVNPDFSSPISLRIYGACDSFKRAYAARRVLDSPEQIAAAIRQG